MAELKLQPIYTIDEYLELDEKSEFRYEYLNGEIAAMAGSSINHNRISRNLCFDLYSKLRGKGKKCEPFMSDVRVQIARESIYYYPDVVVSCEKMANNPKSLSEPILIAEVLSDSTSSKDMGEKMFNYLQINSLQYYLILSQDKTSIFLYEKTDLGWIVKFCTTENEVIVLEKMDITISLKDIYEGVEWETIT